jgi:hypothetical protein
MAAAKIFSPPIYESHMVSPPWGNKEDDEVTQLVSVRFRGPMAYFVIVKLKGSPKKTRRGEELVWRVARVSAPLHSDSILNKKELRELSRRAKKSDVGRLVGRG